MWLIYTPVRVFSGLNTKVMASVGSCVCVERAQDIYRGAWFLRGAVWHSGRIHAASPAALVPFSEPAPRGSQQSGHSHSPNTQAAHECLPERKSKNKSQAWWLDFLCWPTAVWQIKQLYNLERSQTVYWSILCLSYNTETLIVLLPIWLNEPCRGCVVKCYATLSVNLHASVVILISCKPTCAEMHFIGFLKTCNLVFFQRLKHHIDKPTRLRTDSYSYVQTPEMMFARAHSCTQQILYTSVHAWNTQHYTAVLTSKPALMGIIMSVTKDRESLLMSTKRQLSEIASGGARHRSFKY